MRKKALAGKPGTPWFSYGGRSGNGWNNIPGRAAAAGNAPAVASQGAGLYSPADHVAGAGGKAPVSKVCKPQVNQGQEPRARERRTVMAATGGQRQWSCSPGSSNSVPRSDERHDP